MSDENLSGNSEWKITCTALMFAALAATFYGTLPLTLYANESNEYGMGHLYYLVFWIYGLLGIGLFHIENAAFKKPTLIAAIAWSVMSALWSVIINIDDRASGIRNNYPFDPDSSMLFIFFCIAGGFILSLHGRMQAEISSRTTFLIKLTNRFLIVTWITFPLLFLLLIWR